jgi:hypothetical protein
MQPLRNICLYLACLVLIAATAARAQDQAQNQSAGPIPAYHSPLAGIGTGGDAEGDDNSDQSQPENQPLSGVEPLSLGMETTRSYWQPHFDVFGTADSNPTETGEGQNWTTWTTASVGVDIHHVTGISELSLAYTAGGMYSNSNQYTSGNGIIQSLNLADKFSFRRSTLSLFDQVSYLPESAFGFGGLGGVGLPSSGSGAPGLAFNPGQTVLTGAGQMLNNADAVEWDELLTPRSSLTFSGGYSLLHYFGADSNLIDYGVANGRAGYNYQITRNNTLAVVYTFGDYRYANSGQSMIDHTLQLTYGRVVTGKLAFQVAGGPLAVFSTLSPTTEGLTGSGGTSLVSQSQVLWSLNTSLQYQEGRYGLGLAYAHGVNGGSGVLVGSEMNTITGSLGRQMSRTFSSGFSAGYSKNQGLPGTGSLANESYDYWFGGLNLTKPLGPTLGLTLSYQVQYQTSNSAACIGSTCGENVLRHMISVGLGWHERPLLF